MNWVRYISILSNGKVNVFRKKRSASKFKGESWGLISEHPLCCPCISLFQEALEQIYHLRAKLLTSSCLSLTF